MNHSECRTTRLTFIALSALLLLQTIMIIIIIMTIIVVVIVIIIIIVISELTGLASCRAVAPHTHNVVV